MDKERISHETDEFSHYFDRLVKDLVRSRSPEPDDPDWVLHEQLREIEREAFEHAREFAKYYGGVK